MLELIQILEVGWYMLNNRNEPALLQNRAAAKNGVRGHFPFNKTCDQCNESCMENYRGNLILAIGLNNALKADKPKFRESQNVKQMLNNLINSIHESIPNAKHIYFIRPLEVPTWADNESTSHHCRQVYDTLMQMV